MYTLKRGGPKMDPWGTPEKISLNSLYDNSYFCSFFSARLENIKSKNDLSTPWVFNFTISRSQVILSNAVE